MRRFEYHFGNSNKFWEVDIVGGQARFAWGRCNSRTTGASQSSYEHPQRSVKQFSNVRQANAFADKKINEKTRKGYIEIPQGAHTPRVIEARQATRIETVNDDVTTLFGKDLRKIKLTKKTEAKIDPNLAKKLFNKKIDEREREHLQDYIDGLS